MDYLSSYRFIVTRISWRYNVLDHTDCITVDCQWVELKGLPNTYLPTTKLKLMSMSADGSVIVTSIVMDDKPNKCRVKIL